MSVSLSDYQNARDFFNATRDAAFDAERINHTIERMQASEGLHAASLSGRVSGGSASDVMHKTDVRLDYEKRIQKRQQEDYELIDLACTVLYGKDSRGGGIAALKGSAVADAMWWRFCAAAKWSTVERMVGMTERWCREATEAAFDTIDAYGLERVADGLGIAEA